MRRPAPGPIVVTGAPRSGTTYVREILTRHPDVSLTNELRVFRWAHEVLNSTAEPKMHLRGPHRSDVLAAATATLPEMIRDTYGQIFPGVRHWGDKNPFYAEDPAYLHTIVTLFPDARIISLQRDGRDTAASLSRRRTPDGRPWTTLDDAAELWLRCVEATAEFAAAAPAGTFLHVRYDDLVNDDLAVTRNMFTFLGIAMAPEVESFCRAQQRERTPISTPTTDLAEADRADRGSGWRSLSIEDQRRLCARLGPTLVAHGHETTKGLAAVLDS